MRDLWPLLAIGIALSAMAIVFQCWLISFADGWAAVIIVACIAITAAGLVWNISTLVKTLNE